MSNDNNEELTQQDIETIHFFEKVQMESDPTFWANAVVKLPCCACLCSYILIGGLVFACVVGPFYKFDKPFYRDY